MNHLVQIEGRNYELQPAAFTDCGKCAFYNDDLEDDCSQYSLEAKKQVGHDCIKINAQQTAAEAYFVFVEKV